MADVSPVPSEGARALAVDSRAAAPHAPGPVPRASLPPHRARHGPLVRRRSAAAIGPTTQRRVAVDAPQKAAPPARASRMSVGVAAHVIAGNCGVVRRSEPRNPRADCVLGHGVCDGFALSFFLKFSVASIRRHCAAAVGASSRHSGRCACRIRRNWQRGSAVPGFFALFFIAAIPRRPNASDAVEYAISHLETTPKHRLPGVTPSQMTRARGRRRRQPHPSAPGCHPSKKTTQP